MTSRTDEVTRNRGATKATRWTDEHVRADAGGDGAGRRQPRRETMATPDHRGQNPMIFAHLEPIQAKAEGTFAGSTRRSGAGRGLPCAAKPRTSCNPRCRLLQRRVEPGDHRAHIRRSPTEPRAWAAVTWRARARRLAIGRQRFVVTTLRTDEGTRHREATKATRWTDEHVRADADGDGADRRQHRRETMGTPDHRGQNPMMFAHLKPIQAKAEGTFCLLYTSPSPRD